MRVRWQIAVVDTAGHSTWSRLAFSPSGQAAIAYHSSFNNALRFATLNDDGTWAISTIDTASSDCKPSLAFRFGRPAISYRVGASDETGELRYAMFTGGNPPWSINTVAPSANASSLAFNSAHRAGISYYDPASRTLKFATQSPPPSSPSVWISQTVDPDPNVGGFNALAFTPLSGAPYGRRPDLPAIAYHDSVHNQIKYAVFDGSAWHRFAVTQSIGRCSLDFNIFGQPFISYSMQGLIGVIHNSIGWVGIGGTRKAVASSLAFNHYDPHSLFRRAVSYNTDAEVRCAVGDEYSSLSGFLVERAGKTQTGELIGPFELTSVAHSPSGQPAVSYYDSSNYTIKYAGGTIVRTPIDHVIDLISAIGRLLLPRRDGSAGRPGTKT